MSRPTTAQLNAAYDQFNFWYDKAKKLDEELAKAEERIAELEVIRAAAETLVRCKGRYHSEQNYRALSALFGVTTPDLPPLDNEARSVKLPATVAATQYLFPVAVYEADNLRSALTEAGIKWESE